ncbi:hypothetical protein [Paraburkholderia megapolitana]|uniref:Cell wall surface anchor family protein n=1 Tax=Paraburkholderia megapolitana TaxID=420953 RepID=A0A1I3LIW8_9BURK|nr:hypothetical protein [Paraburkholderia megapolitana]QDQ80737.1 hypothetical protein FNZ07_05885 [Paraburkholderia megapolitana]SFI84671.1 hypothetical protein SAMN05192543_104444 [Paraburkholderia megapolitana]
MAADSADPHASPTTRRRRSDAAKPQASSVSTETENKLARAAQSAQRLAQLSDVPSDDSTLDLFPDDPTRATLQAMNIDVRQGTLSGFELPEVVLAAIGAPDGVQGVATGTDTKAVRRVSRSPKSDDTTPEAVTGERAGQWSDAPASTNVGEPAANVNATSGTSQPAVESAEPAVSDEVAQASATASVARSIAALRQSPDDATVSSSGTTSGTKPATPPQRFAATFAKAASASREAGTSASATPSTEAPPADTAASTTHTASTAATTPAPSTSSTFRAIPPAAPPMQHETPRATPELDRARATAFADTVDALYGVIADQRRSATDHSRRMKWMLSIVVGALLVTVAIGIAQTLLLMRLARNTMLQQQRMEQMMLNQQATLATLLDTDSATVPVPAATAPAPAAAQPRPAAPARHPSKAQHGHKSKPTNAH